MARILIVEDNMRLAGLVSTGLRNQGHVCDHVPTLAEATAALATYGFDGIILDLGLPDGDGIDWLRHRAGGEPPALILTARDALEDRVKGLDAGADDYISKPFAMDELGARVRAMLRRPGARGHTRLLLGNVEFDPATQLAVIATIPQELTRREGALLELLLRRSGEVIRRGIIEDRMYTFDEAVTPNAIEAIVSRLRRRLDDAGADLDLHTVRGVGYILRKCGV